MDIAVRSYASEDADALGEVFFRAVREGANTRYSDEQVAAWSPEPPSGSAWQDRLAASETIVAERDSAPVGFMTLDKNGYLDMAFVLPEAMGAGVSDAIYAVLESRARAQRISTLTTQASLLAEPFFARHGWQVTRRQQVEIRGVVLNNAWMEKKLQRSAA